MSLWVTGSSALTGVSRLVGICQYLCVDGTEQEYKPTNFRDQGKNETLNTEQLIFPLHFSPHFLTKTDSTSSSQVLCLILESNLANRSAPLPSANSCFSMEYFRSLVSLLFFPPRTTKDHSLLCKTCKSYRNSTSASSCCLKNQESSAVFTPVWKNPFYLPRAENCFWERVKTLPTSWFVLALHEAVTPWPFCKTQATVLEITFVFYATKLITQTTNFYNTYNYWVAGILCILWFWE